MAKGVVKTVTDKHYGFIKTSDPEADGKDVFYYEPNLEGELATRKLRVDDEVVFDIERGQKGLSAVHIKLAGSEESEDSEVVAETEEVSDTQADDEEEPELEAVA